MFSVKDIRHYGLVADDLYKSLDFYNLLGFSEISRGDLTAEETNKLIKIPRPLLWVKLKNNNFIVELYYFKDCHLFGSYTVGDSPHHISLTVDNIEIAFNTLKLMNLVISEEIRETEQVKLFFCKDPSGNLLELVEEK